MKFLWDQSESISLLYSISYVSKKISRNTVMVSEMYSYCRTCAKQTFSKLYFQLLGSTEKRLILFLFLTRSLRDNSYFGFGDQNQTIHQTRSSLLGCFNETDIYSKNTAHFLSRRFKTVCIMHLCVTPLTMDFPLD